MARLAADASIDVTHVREVNVLRKLVDANPGHGLFLVGEGSELLDLGLVVGGRSLHHRMTTHAGAHRGQTRIERFVGGEVTVKAIHLEGVDVHGVSELHRLHGTVSL